MARAAPKRKSNAKTGAKKAVAKTAPAKKAAAKKPVLKKVAAKTGTPKKAAAKAAAKRPVGRPPGKKAAPKAVAKRPVGRLPGKKAAAPAKAAATKRMGRPPNKTAAKSKATTKRPVGRPAGRKAAPVAKVAPKRLAGRPPNKTIVKPKAAAKRASTKRATAPTASLASRGKQNFSVSHLNEADFKADGLRAYAQYRDLGIAAATNGLCQAHVIRLVPPCTDEVRKRHAHDTELQLIYVLKGWIKNEFAGHGVQMMSAGTCWLQPPNIAHTVLDYSADCEMLEIIVPADFKTAELA